jgi:hypothetical protein
MFALIAAVIFVLAAFNVKLGSVNLVYLALAFWALHHALLIALPLGRTRTTHPNG